LKFLSFFLSFLVWTPVYLLTQGIAVIVVLNLIQLHTHTHTHLVGLLWTRDRPVAKNSTW